MSITQEAARTFTDLAEDHRRPTCGVEQTDLGPCHRQPPYQPIDGTLYARSVTLHARMDE